MRDLPDTTSIVRGARCGDPLALGQMVERFTPWLLVQARYRLRGRLKHLCDPEDLVNDVWAIAFPRLASLDPREGRFTPVLVRFLSTTLLRRLEDLIEKHLISRAEDARLGSVENLPASATGALASAQMREHHERLWRALESLPERDRDLVVLRGLEGHAVKEIATLLGMMPNTVTVAYARACARLRARLGPRLLGDFCE